MINDFRFAFRQLWKAPARFSRFDDGRASGDVAVRPTRHKNQYDGGVTNRMKFHASCRAAHTAAAAENQLC
jgi:hypothetical protein